jgi:hypothetical protein
MAASDSPGSPDDSPKQQDLRSVLEEFSAKIGVQLVVDDSQYLPILMRGEIEAHLRFNVHFKGIFYYSEFGILPPSYGKDVLLFYLQVNESPDCDGFCYTVNEDTRRLAFFCLLPSGYINLPNFEAVLKLVETHSNLERQRLTTFGEGRIPPLPRDSQEPVEAAKERELIDTLKSYLEQFDRALGYEGHELNENKECLLFLGEFRVMVSLVAHKEMIKMMAIVGDDTEESEGCYAALLKSAYFWKYTAGASVAVDAASGKILLVRFLNMQMLDYSRFYRALEQFVTAIDHWQKERCQFCLSADPRLPQEPRDIDRRNPASLETSTYIKDFSRCKEVRFLRQGRFGPIKVVEDDGTNELLALESYDSMTDASELLKEVEMLVRSQHPCIVTFVGYSLPGQGVSPQIATKYPSKGSLQSAFDEMRSGATPSFLEKTAMAKIVSGIVLGMRYIHSRGIVYGSLAPENIFLDEDGGPRIGGFGAGIFRDVNTTLTVKLGNACYAAPETFDGVYSTASDVYSFALILYELVTKEPVFPNGTPLQVIQEKGKRGERPEIPEAVHPVVRRVVTQGWAAEPSVRPSFDQILTSMKDIQFRIVDSVIWWQVDRFVQLVELGKQ